jgi:hypothetical protein
MGQIHFPVSIGKIVSCNPVRLINCSIFQPNLQTPKSIYQNSSSKFPLCGDSANNSAALRLALHV